MSFSVRKSSRTAHTLRSLSRELRAWLDMFHMHHGLCMMMTPQLTRFTPNLAMPFGTVVVSISSRSNPGVGRTPPPGLPQSEVASTSHDAVPGQMGTHL